MKRWRINPQDFVRTTAAGIVYEVHSGMKHYVVKIASATSLFSFSQNLSYTSIQKYYVISNEGTKYARMTWYDVVFRAVYTIAACVFVLQNASAGAHSRSKGHGFFSFFYLVPLTHLPPVVLALLSIYRERGFSHPLPFVNRWLSRNNCFLPPDSTGWHDEDLVK